MKQTDKTVITEFPLRGEWLAPNTPGKKIPSHGTDRLGSRYAYDFLQVDWDKKGWPSYPVHWLKYLIFGIPINKCYCWGQTVYAPCDGLVVRAADGWKERARVHILSDLFVAVKSAHVFKPDRDNLQSVAGNYIIMKCEDEVYAGFVHLQKDSIKVLPGQSVKKGEVLGRIGHSGNSFFPHLHFQIMDNHNLLLAKGVSCAFEKYELYKDGKWEEVHNGIPGDKDRIRFNV